jgi:hypothetical protein
MTFPLVIVFPISYTFQSPTIDTIAVTITTVAQYPARNNVARGKYTGACAE